MRRISHEPSLNDSLIDNAFEYAEKIEIREGFKSRYHSECRLQFIVHTMYKIDQKYSDLKLSINTAFMMRDSTISIELDRVKREHSKLKKQHEDLKQKHIELLELNNKRFTSAPDFEDFVKQFMGALCPSKSERLQKVVDKQPEKTYARKAANKSKVAQFPTLGEKYDQIKR